jgi:intein/homing endonuclease
VTFTNGTSLSVTPEHPFYLPEKGAFVDAGELRPGDVVLELRAASASRSLAQIARPLETKPVRVASIAFGDDTAVVYNFSVDRYVNYFAEGILVHNY